jgi:hypothetical protein
MIDRDALNIALANCSDEELIVVVLAIQLLLKPRPTVQPTRRFISTGRDRYFEILRAPRQAFETLGCSVSTFIALTHWIRPKLPYRRLERTVSVEEKVALFLYICRHASGHRNCENYFARGSKTVSVAFNDVLAALVSLHPDVVVQPTMNAPIPEIMNNPKFRGFRDCVGAIDGTHFAARVPARKNGVLVNQKPYLNRKGYLSQNIAAACDFDLHFSFIHAGYEGSAHDATVLKDALIKQRFQPPPGRYYLADAGYYNCDFLMKPYNCTRYHLREWNEPGVGRPETKEELFNLRHSQLRNHIERIFGVLKRKFKILNGPPQYSLEQQRDLVIALTALFNFIASRDRNTDLDLLTPVLTENDDVITDLPEVFLLTEASDAARKRMEKKRDQIATTMWAEYMRIRSDREREIWAMNETI